MAKRMRYKDSVGYHAQLRDPSAPDPEGTEVEVVEVDTPNGPRRVWADQVAQVDQVVAEMNDSEHKPAPAHVARETARLKAEEAAREAAVAAAKAQMEEVYG
jgi:hypothetical protein